MLGREVRERILSARKRGITIAEIAKVNGVSERSVYKLLAQYRETGSIASRKNLCGRHPALDAQALAELDRKVQQNPDITLSELREELQIPLSIAMISRILREKLGYTYKKRWCMPANRTDPMYNLNANTGWRKSST